jgi:hypothetical protein
LRQGCSLRHRALVRTTLERRELGPVQVLASDVRYRFVIDIATLA